MENPELNTFDIRLRQSPFRRLVPSLYRRLSNLLGRKYSIKKRYGFQFLLDHSGLVDKSMIYSFGWEGEKYKKFIEFCRETKNREPVRDKPTLFLDIGSHWGLYAIRATRESYIDEIYSFEPDPRNIPQLHANLLLNDLASRIKVVEKAVTSSDGACGFDLSPTSNRATSKVLSDDITGSPTVECCKLDSLFDVSNALIIMKIDVEGAEMDALKGMEKLLVSNRIIMMIERHHDLEHLVAYLNGLGINYVGELSDSKGEIDYLFSSCGDWENQPKSV